MSVGATHDLGVKIEFVEKIGWVMSRHSGEPRINSNTFDPDLVPEESIEYYQVTLKVTLTDFPISFDSREEAINWLRERGPVKRLMPLGYSLPVGEDD